MLIWGGGWTRFVGGQESPSSELNDGSAYNPSTRTWHTINGAPVAGRSNHAAVWTGTDMLITGGFANYGAQNFTDGAAYDPSTGRWRPINDMPFLLRGPRAVWTGAEMVVARSDRSFDLPSHAAAYDPTADTWRILPEIPIDNVPPLTSAPGYINQLEWIDGYAAATIEFVHSRTPLPIEPAHRLAIWDAHANRWFTPDQFVLPRGQLFTIAATDDEFLVFTGPSSRDFNSFHYKPATGEIVPFQQSDFAARFLADPTWTGRYVVFTYGSEPIRLDPATEQFVPLGNLPYVQAPSTIWTGTNLIRWGGEVTKSNGQGITTNRGIEFPPRPGLGRLGRR